MYSHLDPLYFLHIPKTAGSTVRAWLRDLVAEEECLERDHPDEILSDPHLPRNYRLYLGHFAWGLPERRPDVAVITFLREPPGLYRSLLDFTGTLDYAALQIERKLIEHSVQLAKIIETTEPAGVLESGLFQDFYSNLLVRNLTSGIAQLDRRPRRITRSDLDLAKQRLEAMPFVGLAGSMERSGLIFSDAFRLPVRPLIMRLNRTARQTPLSAEWNDAVAEANPLDVELYEFGCRLFEARWLALLDRHGLPRSARAGDLEPVLRKAFLSEPRGLKRFVALKADASSDMIVTGFHPRFRLNGRWLRWSGPGPTSRIYLPLDPHAERNIRFDIIHCRSEAIRTGLRIAVDGVPAGSRSWARHENGELITTYQFTLPESPLEAEAQFTEIEIVAPETASMPWLNLGDDEINRGAFALGAVEVN